MVHGLHLDENVLFLCLSVTYEREGLSYLCHAFQKSGLGDEPGWRNTPFSGFHEE